MVLAHGLGDGDDESNGPHGPMNSKLVEEADWAGEDGMPYAWAL